MKAFFAILIIAAFLNAEFKYVKEKWSTDKVFDVPESVLYYSDKNQLFVSNIAGSPTDFDGNGYISLLDSVGNIINKKWAIGLSAPKGMGIYDNKLYVSDINKLVAFSLDNGEKVNEYFAEEAKFLNDISIDTKGIVYVSDMRANAIYRLKDGDFTIWIKNDEKIPGVNGLYAAEDALYIGRKDAIMKTDYKSAELFTWFEGTGGIDGLIKIDENRFITSDWAGKVQLVHKKDGITVLFNTAPENINAADLGYNPTKKILYVPTFSDNRVVAYKVDLP